MKTFPTISVSKSILLVTVVFLLVSIASTASASTSADVGTPPLVGGWAPIKDVNDLEVQELARFALAEYNKKVEGKEGKLQLERVLGGEQQVVAGMNYKLILAASSGDGKDGKYEAVVWVKAWENFKKLTSFRSV